MKDNKRKSAAQLKRDSPQHVLQETGTAYDPTTQHLDLSKEEKRRTTALMMAIQAYNNIIIKDAEMYEAVCREQTRNDKAPRIKEATINAMVGAAMDFDNFISGRLQEAVEAERLRVASEATEAVQG